MTDDRATIFAMSSGRPPAAIAVVRVSGPRARTAVECLGRRVPEARRASLMRLRHPASGEPLDDALALWLPGPRSETGEDTVEFQLHGGRAVVAAVLEALSEVPGLRPAEPGEFTRRAFENGRLDLTAVEGLADLITAETEAQRRLAHRQLAGALGSQAESWRKRATEALALAEAAIDFADEADVPQGLIDRARKSARVLADEIAAVLCQGRAGERLREGLTVAIAGPPNVGKSSLLNRFARREVAIVSPFAGTTRDVIEVHLDLNGNPVTLLDTAGLRETADPVELEGVRRAQERAAAADLVLWLVDSQADLDQGMDEARLRGPNNARRWLIINKVDLIDSKPEHEVSNRFAGEKNIFAVSAKTGQGINELIKALGAYAADYFAPAESALVSRERHRRALDEACAAFRRASEIDSGDREDVIAEELRTAVRSLGRLLGRVDVDDILDVIFRDFCIGK